ncbi:MAG: signal peptidase I [Lachnospiraceae bacterium]
MQEKKQQENGNKKQEIRKEIFSWIRLFVIAIAASLLLNRCVIYSAEIPTGSMENTIMEKDRVIGNRLAYLQSGPERQDIVIFKYPVNEKKTFIKRVIGLPGETVRISSGKIYINDAKEPLKESYLKEEWTVANDGFEFQVPDDCYLMLGDNRNDSLDARYWAGEALKYGKASTEKEAETFQFVSRDKILAKAGFRYWKLDRIGMVR